MRFGSVLAVIAVIGGSAGAAAQSDPVTAVVTGGSGVLTKCYSWFVSPTCNIYHHIAVPQRIAVGDTVQLTYGSNPKRYGFSALRIALHGDHCTIFGEQQGNPDQVDTLVVKPCQAAPR